MNTTTTPCFNEGRSSRKKCSTFKEAPVHGSDSERARVHVALTLPTDPSSLTPTDCRLSRLVIYLFLFVSRLGNAARVCAAVALDDEKTTPAEVWLLFPPTPRFCFWTTTFNDRYSMTSACRSLIRSQIFHSLPAPMLDLKSSYFS